MTVKRQHYVWRNYLRPWASNDQIYCLRDGKLFPSNLMGIAQERYFYKLKELSDHEINVIRKLGIDGTNPAIRPAQENLLFIFTYPFRIKRHFESLRTLTTEQQTIIDQMIIETEEHYQGEIEDIGKKYLELILRNDISFYLDDDKRPDFLFYLCTQYMRTKSMKENVLEATNDPRISKFVDVNNIWNVLSHMYAGALGLSLNHSADYKLILLINATTVPFITGDQPVLNTYAVNRQVREPVSELELYYPVSPKLAILISNKKRSQNIVQIDTPNVNIVKRYNNLIYEVSHEQIYSNQKNILEEINNSRN